MLSNQDVYTKIVLTAIALLLGVLALRPAVTPVLVHAQSDSPSIYVEPGVSSVRLPDSGSEVQGKLVIDLRTGDLWGFPTIYATSGKPQVSKPIYQGRFDFSAMKRVP